MKESFLATWCIRCKPTTDIDQINHLMTAMGTMYHHGDVRKMQRITPGGEILSWEIASAQAQIIASSGQVPFLIKWDDMSSHPTMKLSQENFCAYQFVVTEPTVETHKENLLRLGLEIPACVSFMNAPHPSMSLQLQHHNHTINFYSSRRKS